MNESFEPEEEAPDEFIFVWACGFELGIGLIGLILGWIFQIEVRAYLDRIDTITLLSIAKDIGIGVAAALPMAVAVWLMMKLPLESIRSIKRLGDDPTMKSLLSLGHAELFTISLCAGIGEEFAFRGMLLPWIASMDPSFDVGDSLVSADVTYLVLAVAASSLLFGLVHPITKLYVVIASLMGVYFAALMIWTDNLLVPIVTHAAYDAIQFAMAKRDLDQSDLSDDDLSKDDPIDRSDSTDQSDLN